MAVRQDQAPKLLIPGPVSLNPRVEAALAQPMMDHRSQEFREVLSGVHRKLKGVYRTATGSVVMLSGSGTLAVEAMCYSMVRPGEHVLLLNGGEFGGRMKRTLALRGAAVEEIVTEPGEAPALGKIIGKLHMGHFDVLAFVYTESTTGFTYRDADEVVFSAKKHGMRVITDATSALGAESIPLGARHFDAVSAASQKVMGAPPGVSFVGLSKEAAAFASRYSGMDTPRYLDLGAHERFYSSTGELPFTPAVNIFYALDTALDLMREEGPKKKGARLASLSALAYERMPDLGFAALVGNEYYRSTAVASFVIPEHAYAGGLTSELLRDEVQTHTGLRIARGQGALTDRVIRIGTMGDVEERDIMAVADEIEYIIQDY